MPARRERCAAIAAELDIPAPFHMGRFLDRVEARRGRKIYLHPFRSGPGAPCGVWIGTDTADHVFHEEATSSWHQGHIILHEVSHMLLEHGHGSLDWQGLARELAPGLDAFSVRRVLGRSAYSTEEEREAETLASLLGQAAPPRRQPPVGEGTGAMMCRLEQTWGNGRRPGRGGRAPSAALPAAEPGPGRARGQQGWCPAQLPAPGG